MCAFTCIRSSSSSRPTKSCLSSWLQSCLSCCPSSRSIPPASTSILCWPVPSSYESSHGTIRCTRGDALWSSWTSPLSYGSRWISSCSSCRCSPRSISTLPKRRQTQRLSSSSWRAKSHVWSLSRGSCRNGNGASWAQSKQKDAQEDEKGTQT